MIKSGREKGILARLSLLRQCPSVLTCHGRGPQGDNAWIRAFLLRQKHIGPKDRAIVHLNGASQITRMLPVAICTSSIWFELITCLESGVRRELIQELLNYRID
jgi:hypothetical protein